MAHELTIRENGKVEMAYVGDVPWHGLGNELQPGAPIETWLESAGMNWKAVRAFVRFNTDRTTADDASKWSKYDGSIVLFRSDTKAELAIVGDKFKVVQPYETLEFFRDLVGAAGFELSTAGTLFGGRKFWALAKTNAEAIVLDKRDRVRANLLLATAVDGTMATTGKFVATQVVCNNTLQMASGERGALQVKVNHRSTFDPQTVKAELGIESAISAFDRTIAAMRRMAETRMTHESMIRATAALIHADFDTLTAERQNQILRTKPVEPIARMACDNTTRHADIDGANGTVYGLLNAVTQYIDHDATTRGEYKGAEGRLNSAWFGKGAELKDRAFAMACDIVDHAGRNPAGSGATAAVDAWIARHS